MKSVKELKEELNKFNDDDMCFAYEGEVIGIVINRGNHQQGVIYCGEGDQEKATETIREGM